MRIEIFLQWIGKLRRAFNYYYKLPILLFPLIAVTHADATELSLLKAIEMTLENNPSLHFYRLRQEQIQGFASVERLSPGLELGIELENVAGNGEFSGTAQAEITLALSSVIELGGKLESRQSAANARLQKSELQRKAKTLDVLADVTRHFIGLMATQEQFAIANESAQLSSSMLKTLNERMQRGAVSEAEVMRAKALLTQAKIQRDSLQRKYERQKIRLARFWGQTDVDFSTVTGDLYTFGKEQEFAALYEKVKQSPSIQSYASDLRLKDAEVRLAKTQSQADLTWQIGVRRFEETGDSALTLGVSMPLFSKSRNSGAIKAAQAARNSVEFESEERLLELHERLFTAYSQRQQFISAHELLKDAVIPDLEKALGITEQAYERGRLGYQDWIMAQQELLDAKRQMIETATAALLNQAVIEQLTAQPLTQ